MEDGRWKPDARKGECGFRTGAYTILGGRNAKQGEFPFMVIYLDNQNFKFSLVNYFNIIV